MPRTATKWLVAWFTSDGKLKDAIEQAMFIVPEAAHTHAYTAYAVMIVYENNE